MRIERVFFENESIAKKEEAFDMPKKRMSEERFGRILEDFEKHAELNFHVGNDVETGKNILRKVLLEEFEVVNVDLEDMDFRDNDFAL